MRILITGNMGYVGPVVVAGLRAGRPDAELVGLDAGYYARCLTGAQALPERLLDVQHFADVRALPAGALDGVDAVVHLAAISNDPIGNRYEDVTYAINHSASVEVARQAKQAGARAFVFASSCSVYGSADDAPRTESSPLGPLTAYARSKVMAEEELHPLADDDFTVTCLRFATACGWSDRLRLDLVLNDFVAGALASRNISILSDGTPWRPLIHVRDMARAIDWAVDRPQADGGAALSVNVGSNEWNVQVRGLADAVARVVPGVDVSVNPDAQPDKRSYRVDFSRYRELAPDHQPRVGLEEAVIELAEGLRKMGFDDAGFRDSDLMRLRVLEDLRERGLLDGELRWIGIPLRDVPTVAAGQAPQG
jgi:nucleoside-diphosphate-sugar epimerase